MTFPTLPTDNLYKFLALTGFAVFLLGAYEMERALDRMATLTADITIGLKVREYENNQAQAAIRRGESVSPLRARTAFYDSVERASRSNGLTIDTLAARYSAETDRARTQFENAQILYFAGIVVALIGFSMWGTKVQYYQDMILRREAGVHPPIRKHIKRLSSWRRGRERKR